MSSEALVLLDRLIATPSFSGEETRSADLLTEYLTQNGVDVQRIGNNVLAKGKHFSSNKPTLLLNSHHDTVRPAKGYTLDPFEPFHHEGKIFGLGSNDAGASVVSLIETFLRLHTKQLGVNLVLCITAEEEISGKQGMARMMEHFRQVGTKIDMAIVGEPTGMEAAIAEKGLVVLDCKAEGKSGHAARDEGVNAIYKAINDIERLRNFKFPRVSKVLGDIKISTTMITAGTQHNMVPDICTFVVDVRTTDSYTNEQTVAMLDELLNSQVTARSTRLNASVIDMGHPLVMAAMKLGAGAIVSPTMSDRALMPGIPALKIGPGDSSRSHTANEFIYEEEILHAINFYQQLIEIL